MGLGFVQLEAFYNLKDLFKTKNTGWCPAPWRKWGYYRVGVGSLFIAAPPCQRFPLRSRWCWILSCHRKYSGCSWKYTFPVVLKFAQNNWKILLNKCNSYQWWNRNKYCTDCWKCFPVNVQNYKLFLEIILEFVIICYLGHIITFKNKYWYL